MNSPNSFDKHCTWLLKEMLKKENLGWNNKRINYFFKEEIKKNLKLAIGITEKIDIMRRNSEGK